MTGLQAAQNAAIDRAHTQPQPVAGIDVRIRAHIERYGQNPARGLVAAGGLEDFVNTLITRRAHCLSVGSVTYARQLEERIIEVLNEVERTGQITTTLTCHRRKCDNTHEGLRCGRGPGHKGWHQNGHKEWNQVYGYDGGYLEIQHHLETRCE